MLFFTAFVLSACYWALNVSFQLTWFNHCHLLQSPMFLSRTDQAVLSLFVLPAFNFFVLLYSYHQHLFNSSVSSAFRSPFLVQHSLWHSTALYHTELLVCTACQQRSMGVNLYAYWRVSVFISQSYLTLLYSSWLFQPHPELLLQLIYWMHLWDFQHSA